MHDLWSLVYYSNRKFFDLLDVEGLFDCRISFRTFLCHVVPNWQMRRMRHGRMFLPLLASPPWGNHAGRCLAKAVAHGRRTRSTSLLLSQGRRMVLRSLNPLHHLQQILNVRLQKLSAHSRVVQSVYACWRTLGVGKLSLGLQHLQAFYKAVRLTGEIL